MKKALYIFATIALVAVLALAGRYGTDRLIAAFQESGSGEAGGQGRGERPATSVSAASPEMRSIRETFETVGTIRPARSISVRPLATGRVVRVAITSGATVAEGETLFTLDDRAERAELARAEATLTEAQSEFRRYEELENENVATEARLEEARGAFLRAQAAVQAARARLDDRQVTAPFGGVLGIVDLDPGERVDPEMVITTLDDLSAVEVDFAVPERYLDRVRVGQTVALSVAAYPDQTFEGEVSFVAPRVGENSRSFTARARLDNPDRALVGGMFANATLVFGTRDALTVPDDAVISEGTATYVFVVADGSATRTDVAIGLRQAGRTEILDGLAPQDRIITAGYDTISDGSAVSVAEAPAAGEALN